MSASQKHALQSGAAQKLISLSWLLNTRIGAKTLSLWINFIFNNPRIGDSSLVTNIGRLWIGNDKTTYLTRIGDADITSLYITAPPSPSTGSYSGFFTYNNKLYYMFNYFEWAMSEIQAHQFADLFEQTLEYMTNIK